jgi:hypothetical protein
MKREKVEEYFNAWVTKYALTTGMFETRVRLVSPTMVQDMAISAYYHKPDWHRDYDKACEDVLRRLKAKRKSIEGQLKRLDNLEAMIGRKSNG